MGNTLIILQQTGIMFFYMAVGFALFKSGLITREGSRSMANLLLYAVIPAVMLNSFCAERTPERVTELAVSILMGAGLLVLSMLVSGLLFRKSPVDNFGASFSNAGFIGFPLVTALLGADAVFYATGFVAILNVLQWTYGQYLLSRNRSDLNPLKVLRNPIVLSLVAGLIIFFSGVKMPSVVTTVLTSVSAINSPLAMIVLGVYLAQLDVKSTVTNWHIYAASAVRLVVIPLLSFLLLQLLPDKYDVMRTALFVVCMAPVGSNVAVYAQKQNKDYPYAVGLVCVSTVFSIVTIPIIMGML